MKKLFEIIICLFLLNGCTLQNRNDATSLVPHDEEYEISNNKCNITDKIETIIRNDDELVYYLKKSREDRVEVKINTENIVITLGRPDSYSYSPTIIINLGEDEIRYSYEFFKSVDFKYEKNGELLNAELYAYVKGNNKNQNRQPRHMRLKTPNGYFEFTIVDDKFYYDPEQIREIEAADLSKLKEMQFLDDLELKLLQIYHDFTDNLFSDKNQTIEAIVNEFEGCRINANHLFIEDGLAYFDNIKPIEIIKEYPINHKEKTNYYYASSNNKFAVIDENGKVLIPYIQTENNPFFYNECGKNDSKTHEIIIIYNDEDRILFENTREALDNSEIYIGGGHGTTVVEYHHIIDHNQTYLSIGGHDGPGSLREIVEYDFEPFSVVPVKIYNKFVHVETGYLNYDYAEEFQGYSFINSAGKLITNKRYKDIGILGEKYIPVHTEAKGWNIIDQKGKEILNQYYDEIILTDSDELIVVSSGNKYGIITNKNEIVLQLEYECISPFGKNRFLIKKGNKWLLRTYK